MNSDYIVGVKLMLYGSPNSVLLFPKIAVSLSRDFLDAYGRGPSIPRLYQNYLHPHCTERWTLKIREVLKCSSSSNGTLPGEKIRHVHGDLITSMTQQFELFSLRYLRSSHKDFSQLWRCHKDDVERACNI